MYELLFRSRWFALAWVVMITISALLFTTTGAGAVLTGTAPKSPASEHAGEEAAIGQKVWAEDESSDEADGDPALTDSARGNASRDVVSQASPYNAAPYANADTGNSEVGTGQ